MQVLTDNERAHLIKILAGAPDEILCNAVRDTQERQEYITQQYKLLVTPKSRDAEAPVQRAPEALKPLDQTVDEKPYVPKPIQVPPGEACTRVGSDVRAVILKTCSTPSTAEQINTALKRGPAALDQTISTMKLLWTRGDVVYADKLYEVKK